MYQYTLYIIFLVFRQTDPVKSRVASRNLSDDANGINMKKVQVNAKVTAMVSTIETLTNVTFIILLGYFGGTNVFSLIFPLLLYDILLPYAFLMNTSHNKNRIVELGWKNVFMNLFRSLTSSANEEEHAGNENVSNETTSPTPKPIPKSKDTDQRGVRSSIILPLFNMPLLGVNGGFGDNSDSKED